MVAAGPVAGSLWWLAKGGGRLLSKPLARTALTALGIGSIIPGISEGVKDEIIESDLNFREKDADGNPVIPKHDLNLYQHLMLGDFKGMLGDTTVEEALSRNTRNRMREKVLNDSPNNRIRDIEVSTGNKYKLSDDPLEFIAANRKEYENNERIARNKGILADDNTLFYSDRAVNQRNLERQAREREHRLLLAREDEKIRQFNALLGQRRESELSRIEQARDSNRLLQMQLSNDQDRYMYDLETKRLGTKGKKQDAVFDALRAIGYAFGI